MPTALLLVATDMGRPYPVPVQIATVYTESRGNVDVSTVELRQWDGSIMYETCLFWDSDDSNPDDIGSVVVERTAKKAVAYMNHNRWCFIPAIEARIHKAINDMREANR